MTGREGCIAERALLAVALFLLPLPVHALPVPKIVCIECHGSLTGKYAEPVKLWQESIHAGNGIACNACHGGDPTDAAMAMSPARGFLGAPKEKEIPSFCGRCHPGVLADYAGSAHGRRLGSGGPTCVTCHGNHLVVRASLDLINEKSCSRCHSFDRARDLRRAIEETERLIAAISLRTARLKNDGGDAERLDKALFSARNSFRRLFHSVDTARVRGESARIRLELKKVEAELDRRDRDERQRRVAGGLAVAGALLGAGLCRLLGKTFD